MPTHCIIKLCNKKVVQTKQLCQEHQNEWNVGPQKNYFNWESFLDQTNKKLELQIKNSINVWK